MPKYARAVYLLVLLTSFIPVIALNFTTEETPSVSTEPQCSLNETLFQCTDQFSCCQSQSDALVWQLTEIKDRFSGVEEVITADYARIEGIVNSGLNDTLELLHSELSANFSQLYPVLNTSLYRLNRVFLGYGNWEDLFTITRALPRDILRNILTRSGRAYNSGSQIRGIKIFWDLEDEQRECVVNYMVDSTGLGEVVRTIASNMRNTTQSIHEYMSLLGTMKAIVKNLVDAPQARDCFNEIVKMQQCSLCTDSSVCPAYYDALLSQCVPQLEELYARWDSLMGAMSQLTLRLCNNSPHDAYNHTLLLADFITSGRLNSMIYRHGVLAYMKCVQQDTQKRSAEASRREESMKMDREEIFDFNSEDTLIDDIRLSRRSLEEFSQIPPQEWSRERQLDICRTKLGLLFPPLDLGTNRILNITVGSENKECWNGTAVGGYAVDYFSPRHEKQEVTSIEELDQKMCQYAMECSLEKVMPVMNNAHHGPTMVQILASMVASLYYCCC